MPKLSDSQLVVLSTACQRSDRYAYPVTLKLKGNAVGNVLKSLVAKGLLEEIPGGADDTPKMPFVPTGAPRKSDAFARASRTAYPRNGVSRSVGFCDKTARLASFASTKSPRANNAQACLLRVADCGSRDIRLSIE